MYHMVEVESKRINHLKQTKAYETDKGRLNQKPLSRRSENPIPTPVLYWLFRPSKAVIDAHAELESSRGEGVGWCGDKLYA